jgi:hypothetical protein
MTPNHLLLHKQIHFRIKGRLKVHAVSDGGKNGCIRHSRTLRTKTKTKTNPRPFFRSLFPKQCSTIDHVSKTRVYA